MPPGLRKLALTVHLVSSVGWLGAVAGFLALAVAGLTGQGEQITRAAYLAMDLTAWFVIVPLSLASLLTGLLQSLGTTWGLLRHYWVLAGLTARFERLRDDGLAGGVDPAAAARAFLAAAHSAALFEAMTRHGSPEGLRAHVEALVEVLWVGLAPPRLGGE
jgi:hypothetical protein